MALWASIVASPLVFLANLSLVYALVPVACASQRDTALHVSNGIALVLTLGALAFACQALHKSALPERAATDTAGLGQFLSRVGIWVSALMALAIVLQWSTQWLLTPCIA